MCRSIVLSIWGTRWRTKWKTHWIRWILYKTNESSAHWPPSCLMSLKKRNWARGIMRRQELVPDGSCWFLLFHEVPNFSQPICYLPDHFFAKICICPHQCQCTSCSKKSSLHQQQKPSAEKLCAPLALLVFLVLVFFLAPQRSRTFKDHIGCVWKWWYTPPCMAICISKNDVFNIFNHQIWMFFLNSVSPRCAESPSPPPLGAATGGATAGRVHKPGPH